MELLDDRKLYTSSDHCLKYCRSLSSRQPAQRQPEDVIVHFYWAGSFQAKQALALKSLLATQDLSRTTCWLWVEDDDAAESPHLAPFRRHISVKRYDVQVEARDTPLADQPWLRWVTSAVVRSDVFRLIVPYKYGGIYTDMDAMFLRNMGPLLDSVGGREFCFQWSFTPVATNAFYRSHRGSNILHELMLRVRGARDLTPTRLLRFHDLNLPLLVLPAAVFSPLWLQVDGKDTSKAAPFGRFTDFFRKFGVHVRKDRSISSHRDFFPGAFTYHWHNCWRDDEHSQSYAGLFDKEFNQILSTKLGISFKGLELGRKWHRSTRHVVNRS